jgi:AmiR/NasT family two-component response regulator
VDKKTVLIISEHPADFYSLTAALERAEPPRFKPVTVNTRDQPVDALIDPANDAVILASTLETEYLLRLAQKKHLSLPIIVLIDNESETQIRKLKEAGATDYIVRGLISDDMLHRVLDYSIVLRHVTAQHEQVLQQQRIERAAQEAGEHLQTVAGAVGERSVGGPLPAAGETGARSPAGAAAARAEPDAQTHQAPPTVAVASGDSRTLAVPWRTAIMVLMAGMLVVVAAALLNQRLENESRLSRLEASNDILSAQLNQIHSDLSRAAASPALEPPAAAPSGPAIDDRVLPLPASEVPVAQAVPGEPLEPPQPRFESPASPVAEHTTPGRTEAPPRSPTPLPVPETGASSPLETEAIPVRETDAGELAGSWFLNLGTFSSQNAARRFARDLGPTSYQLEIVPVQVGGRDLYRVRLPGLPSEEVAEALATDYQLSLGVGRPWVGRD